MHLHLNHDKNYLISIVNFCLFSLYYFLKTFLIDPHDRFFEQENNMGFFTTNIDQQTTAGSIRRRVSSIFGDTNPEGRYYEPQKITDDTLMDVSIHFSINSKQFLLS
jgi:hypothetical protein